MYERWIMVKKSAQQVGFGRLQTVKASTIAKVTEETLTARDGWRRLYPQWTFRIVDPHEFGGASYSKYKHHAMYDDTMELA